MKPRRLHSATISSRVGPASVAALSLTGAKLPVQAALLRPDLELGRLALGVADLELEDQLRVRAEARPGLHRPLGEFRGEGLDRLLRAQLQRALGVLHRNL